VTPVSVSVTDKLIVDARNLSDECVKALKEMCEHDNPQYFKLKSMGYATYTEPKIYRMWKGGPGWLTLPRGVLSGMRQVMRKHGFEPEISDDRTDPNPIRMPKHNVRLYDYQDTMVERALEVENCILKAGTGSGKSTAGLAFICRARMPALVVVHASALYDQWRMRAAKELSLLDHEIGIIRAGRVRLRPVTIAMQQSLAHMGEADRKAIRSYFGVVLCDEVHKFAAKTFLDVVDWLPARYRIGLSADEKRKDRREFLVYDMFGKVAYEVPNRLLVDRNFVLDVEVRVHPTGAEYSWYRNGDSDFNALLSAITSDDGRTNIAVDLAAAEARAGHQVLVMSQRRDHCVRIAAGLAACGVRPGLMLGGDEDAEEMRKAVRGFADGSVRAAVGTIQAVGTGVDLPSVSRGVIASPIGTNKQLVTQVKGRFCRTAPGKKDAVMHYLYDELAFGETSLRNLDRWNDTVRVAVGAKLLEVGDYLDSTGIGALLNNQGDTQWAE
jgi:superfamily II DNA or RNA helicase